MTRHIVALIGLGLLTWANSSLAASFLTEVVDPAGSGPTSFAFDSQGRPHVTYSRDGSLRHAVKAGGGWVSEPVPGVDYAGRRSLAIGPRDEPVIAHWTAMGTLGCATRSGGVWTTETVHPYGGLGEAIALDEAGNPHIISYIGLGSLLHSTRTDGAWTTQTVTSIGGNPPTDMCIGVDSQGLSHIASERNYGAQVFHSSETELGWATEVLDETPPGVRPEHSVSLALDAQDHPFLAYTDYATNSLKYATRSEGAWSLEVVPGTTVGSATNLALDAGGTPHIAYQSDGALWYVTRGSEAWTAERIIAGGSSPSMALDADGKPYVAHHGERGVQCSRVIECVLTFAPRTVTENRRGSWITAYIETDDFPLSSVNPASVLLAGAVPCEPKFATMGDGDRDGVPDLMLKFSTDDVLSLLEDGDNSLELTGRLVTGEEFLTGGSLRMIPEPGAGDLALRIVSRPGSSRVAYLLESAANTARIQMFDVRGRLVGSWSDRPGQAVQTWDGRDRDGRLVGSGIYFLRAEANGQSISKRIVMSR